MSSETETTISQAIHAACMRYLSNNAVHCDERSGMWHVPRLHESFTTDQMADAIWCETGQRELPEKMMRHWLKKYLQQKRSTIIGGVKTLLLEDAPLPSERAHAEEQLRAFVRLIARENSDERTLEYYTLAFKQFIWQVKRRLRGLNSWWEIMLVCTGGQGSGKSSAVDKFCRPLALLYCPDADFSIFTDRFRTRVFNRSYVIRLDEMEGVKKADIQKIKRIITSSDVQGRGIYTGDEEVLTRNASFIGTSNASLVSSIADSTGMRRFVEVKCREEKYKEAWGKELRAIDYARIWAHVETGLDETAPMADRKGYESYAKEIEQEAAYDEFQAWWDNCVRDTGKEDDIISNMEAHTHFRDRMCVKMHVRNFAARMRASIGDESRMFRIHNAANYRGYKLVDGQSA